MSNQYECYVPVKIENIWQGAIMNNNPNAWFRVYNFIDGMLYAISLDTEDVYMENLMLLRSIANLNSIAHTLEG